MIGEPRLARQPVLVFLWTKSRPSARSRRCRQWACYDERSGRSGVFLQRQPAIPGIDGHMAVRRLLMELCGKGEQQRLTHLLLFLKKASIAVEFVKDVFFKLLNKQKQIATKNKNNRGAHTSISTICEVAVYFAYFIKQQRKSRKNFLPIT